eukprot:scaffold9052_cov107-Isochrysis_galbana.AAC.4
MRGQNRFFGGTARSVGGEIGFSRNAACRHPPTGHSRWRCRTDLRRRRRYRMNSDAESAWD